MAGTARLGDLEITTQPFWYKDKTPGSAGHSLVTTDLLDYMYEGWNFNSGNYLFTTDTK